MEKFVPFFKPSFSKAEEEALLRVLHSGWLTTGSETLAFEKEFAEFVNVKHALACNSASSGLILAMEALGVKQGKKILTTPYTFISTATSAIHLGGEVSYVDVEKKSYNMDANLLEDILKKDKDIACIVPIHIAGNVCNMKDIISLAKKYKVFVIEDSAHSFPAKTSLGYAGTLGDAGVFSFYATKTITTGEGGMVCLKDDEIAKRITIMRSHGMDRSAWDRYTSEKASYMYDIIDAGWKFNLPDILSAIGREQLKRANDFYEKRKTIAVEFNKAFSNYEYFKLPPDSEGNAWHLYLLRINEDMLKITRDEFIKKLQQEGLGVSVHFIPHFEFTFIKNRYGITRKDFPESYQKYKGTISLPFYPDMKKEDMEFVIEKVIKIAKENKA
ncbi:MAG: DegT/DnrJ/EryC1/StrS family aminotransferase [Treponema sp.]